jgi:hypothetical protein
MLSVVPAGISVARQCVGGLKPGDPAGVPNVAVQKRRWPWLDERRVAGSAPSQAKAAASQVPQATTGAPLARWHIRQ